MVRYYCNKTPLFLALFIFSCQIALAGGGGTPTYSGWYTYAAKIKVNETGLGKVYGSFTDEASARNPSAAKTAHIVDRHRWASVTTEDKSTNEFTLYLYAVANTSTEEGVTYEFVEWQNGKGERVANSNQLDGTASVASFVTINTCGEGFSSSQGTSTNNFNQEHQDYHDAHKYYDEETKKTVAGDRVEAVQGFDSTYVAVFRRVYKTALVTVSINEENAGFVECNPTPFELGTQVTLLTYTKDGFSKGYENKFIGWKKDGEFLRDDEGNIVKDVPLTFIVSESNQGHYEAVYEPGYKFYHIVNKSTNRVINGVNDQGSITDFSSLQLADYDKRFINAGTVFQINSYQTTGGYPHDFIVQGYNTGEIYDFTVGSARYVTMERNVDDFTWSIFPNSQPIYMADEGENSVTAYGARENSIAHWYIEPMDKDLETKENYFSLDPDKLVEVGGKYYTTLRTSWNILFNPEQMTPYIVSRVNEAAGTFEMEPITGNIIPAGTPVVIETSSADVEENRMVPTTTAAASGAVPSGNQLVCSTKYFPNQSAPTSPCKGLTVSNGKLTFGGSNLSTVNGNEAYLRVANEVALPPKVTLAELLASGDTENTYIVTDLTAVEVVNDDQLIIAKDDNGYATKDVMPEGGDYVDYMHMAGGIDNNVLNITVPEEYDQSNWIALRVPAGVSLTTNMKGKHLTGVKGRLVNTANPEFVLDKLPGTEDEGVASTALNVFIPASFKGTQPSTVGSQKDYFFVQPKPMEMANITWAQWDGEKFISPVHDDAHPDWNQAELVGSFELNGAYLEAHGGGSLDMSTLKSGHAYAMTPAVIKLKTGNYDHVYVLGTVNGLNWDTNKGVEMETTDGTVYTAIVTANNSDDGYDYFSFTKELGTSWEAINASRFGSEASGSYWDVLDQHYNTPLTLRYWGGSTGSFRVPEGTYLLTVTLVNSVGNEGNNYYAGSLIIKRAGASQAPRRAGTERQYVVYPISMTQITSEENNVVTGVSTVGGDRVAVSRQYVNVAGVRASQPWNGVNIVITTYSDGTTTATKQLH